MLRKLHNTDYVHELITNYLCVSFIVSDLHYFLINTMITLHIEYSIN